MCRCSRGVVWCGVVWRGVVQERDALKSAVDQAQRRRPALSLEEVRALETRLQRRITSLKSEYDARLAVRVSAARKQCHDMYEQRLAALRVEAKEYAVRCVRVARRRMAQHQAQQEREWRALLQQGLAAPSTTGAASAAPGTSTSGAAATATATAVAVQRHSAVQTDGDDLGFGFALPEFAPEVLSPDQTATLLQSILQRSIPLGEPRCVGVETGLGRRDADIDDVVRCECAGLAPCVTP